MNDPYTPSGAAKGILRQTSLQLPPDVWDYLDKLVEIAKNDDRCTFTGRIGRGDVIGGLVLAAQINSEGMYIPMELIACGIHQDDSGDCLACCGTGVHLHKGPDYICPLCNDDW